MLIKIADVFKKIDVYLIWCINTQYQLFGDMSDLNMLILCSKLCQTRNTVVKLVYYFCFFRLNILTMHIYFQKNSNKPSHWVWGNGAAIVINCDEAIIIDKGCTISAMFFKHFMARWATSTDIKKLNFSGLPNLIIYATVIWVKYSSKCTQNGTFKSCDW